MDKYDNVLFYNELRIIDDRRFELLRQGSTWNLRITGLVRRDAGKYRCVVNSDPVIFKYYELTVYGE